MVFQEIPENQYVIFTRPRLNDSKIEIISLPKSAFEIQVTFHTEDEGEGLPPDLARFAYSTGGKLRLKH